MSKVSYVLPVFNEGAGIEEFYKALTKDTKKLEKKHTLEFIFVNDGSTDDSLDKLTKIYKKDKRVKVINFSRNFGHQMALTAGLDMVDADAVIVMDTDLQDPPAVSVELVEEWEKGIQVVYAQRRSRIDNIFKRMAIHVHYRILKRLTSIDIPLDTGDFRLMDRIAVEEFRRFREQNRYIRGIVPYLGFKQGIVRYDRSGRFAGTTNYPFSKLVKLATDGITSFSTVPLQLISRLGFLVFFFSFLGIIYVLITRIFMADVVVPGWAVTMISIFFLGGIQMMTLGVIGSYLGRIYTEVQNRPLYIVSKTYSHDS